MNKHITTLTTIISVLAAGLMFAPSVFAAPVQIRMDQPASTVGEPFRLGFTALDINERPVSVQCFKQGPGESMTAFGDAISLAAGGNHSYCDLTSGILSVNGHYTVKVTATAGSDSESDSVDFDYSKESPQAIRDYRKEKQSDCDYKISFKTADDSLTSYVEIYRSENQSFSANGDSRITTMSVGPNTEKTYNDHVAECQKSYYYTIRAFSAAGTGSGLAGDEVEKITSVTIINPSPKPGSTTQAAIPVSGGSVLGSASDSEASDSGSVLGDESTPAAELSANKDKKSEATAVSKKYVYAIVGIGVIILAGYIYAKTRKSSANILG